MKVALCTLAVRPGGVARHVLDLAVALRERGVDVVVGHVPEAEWTTTSMAADVEFAFTSALPACDVLHLHLANTYDRKGLFLLLKWRLTHRRSARVVTEHLPRTNTSDPSLDYSRHTRGTYTLRWLFKRLEFSLCDAVIAVSAGSARFLEVRYGYKGAKVVENGLRARSDPAISTPSTDEWRVWVIGDLGWHKGHTCLIEAAALSRYQWPVVVAGDGAHRTRLETLAQSVAPGRFTFLGRQRDVDDLLRCGDVGCMPSRWEASPYAALEMMDACLPVVASRTDGLEDIVIDGVTGHLVGIDDPQALADALDDLAENRDKALTMGRAGSDRLRARYDIERMANETFAVYRGLR